MNPPIRQLDFVAVAVYLLAMVAFGIYFARRNKTTEEYFVGNRAFSGWVIGLSMLGTIISSATFLALPAAAYVLDWRQLAVNLVLPIVAIVAVVVFIPFAFYTIAGGVEAVVRTDVVQAVILLLGGLLCFACVAIDLPGGLE